MANRNGVFVRLTDEQLAKLDHYVAAAPVPTSRTAVAGMLLREGIAAFAKRAASAKAGKRGRK